MMKWVSIILGLLFGAKPSKGLNFKEMAMEVFDESMARSRKPIGLILLGLASIIFICGGVFISLVDATRQYDASGSIYFGATFWSGLILSAIVLVGYIYVFSRAWPGVKHMKARAKAHEQAQEASKGAPGLDEALSLLIMDHIESRKISRSKKQEARSNAKTYSQTERKGEPPIPPTGFA
ncbi:hypothetical protein [Bdellovibrio svalbardensis]|uniref:Uncharacterized protein n=1 Tax=Bdellovibrio svalbardensis TaxID=2972972 RepID=A0ABT6DGQ7_9BACT|nr:hypothetical protein [Bdellovibrio svalbardensis]MDG0816038.1 hypothetical protein [Bdellovibrio svalbardensis]